MDALDEVRGAEPERESTPARPVVWPAAEHANGAPTSGTWSFEEQTAGRCDRVPARHRGFVWELQALALAGNRVNSVRYVVSEPHPQSIPACNCALPRRDATALPDKVPQ